MIDGREEGERGWVEIYFGGFGDAVAEDLDFDVTDRGVEGDGHGRREWPSSLTAHKVSMLISSIARLSFLTFPLLTT